MTSKTHTRGTSLISGKSLIALSGLSSYGIAHPLLEMLGKNPEFLVVHHIGRWDLIFLVLLLTVIPALILGLLTWVAGQINESLGNRTLFASATFLLTIVAAPLINDLHLPGLIAIPLSIIPAFLIVWKLGANPKLHQFWSLLGIIPFLVAGLFFSTTVPWSILLSKEVTAQASYENQPAPQTDIPVVMVVFDAFPTYSIMDSDHQIDGALCPNLATLNEDAVWYKNALAISDDTLVAVPAILTGLIPRQGQQANQIWHPNNLFSWLAPWRPLHVQESHTRMSALGSKPGFIERWNLTASDVWIIFLHQVLSEDFAENLPSITRDWMDFAGTGSSGKKDSSESIRINLFDKFLGSFFSDEPGSCYFLHSLFPHTPFQYLPSGRRYTIKGKEPSGQGMQFGEWEDDIQAVVHSQQRLLNQVGYTDYLVGKIICKLKDEGLYENALIIFTADHGMSFSPGDNRRKLSTTNMGDILPIPLFIKYPGKGNGCIDDRVVQSIDILPTIASVLKSPLPWETEGRNLLDPLYKGRGKVQYLGATHRDGTVEFYSEEILAQRDSSITVKFRRFQQINGRMVLSAPFRGAELIGIQVPSDLPQQNQWTISMDGAPGRYVPNLPEDLVPAEVQGTITGKLNLPNQWDIAILVDKRIAALTRPFKQEDDGNPKTWSTLLPDDFLIPGEHFLETILVDWSQGTPKFFRPVQP